MKPFHIVIAWIFIMSCSCSNRDKNGKTLTGAPTDTLFSKGKRITNNNFKGNTWLNSLTAGDSLTHIKVGNVTFAPGARTNWHTHPGGQILLATGGVGYYHEKGKPKRILRKGDVVECPPDIPHWHDAGSDTGFIQIAITNTKDGETAWLGPVSDEEYNSFTKVK